MKKLVLCSSIALSLLGHLRVSADEGMWIPILLGEGTEAEMLRLGMKITAEDLYSINKPSIKDAIVLFGGGCTAEIVSEQGLILTNHHCGYSIIQSHSSLENNYLVNGFWAQSLKEELPAAGLKATIMVRMEDVTSRVIEGITDKMDATAQSVLMAANIEKIEAEASGSGRYSSQVKAFYYGNQYFLIVSEVFKDVRLVGAPPSSIGKFGGETDNWMWPRHTGDFSVFRIYADKDNKPAEYSENNIPYVPNYSLTISLKGVKENDFTMVFGYPGQTQEYLPSFAIELQINHENPAMIKIRQKRLEIMGRYMNEDKLIRLQYSAKYSSVANYWKKMIGENGGIRRMDGIRMKKDMEKSFSEWVNSDNTRKVKYGHLMTTFREVYKELGPYYLAQDYVFEAGLGIEIVRFARNFNKLVTLSEGKKSLDNDLTNYIEQLKKSSASFFKNYQASIDKEVMISLLHYYFSDLDPAYVPNIILNNGAETNGNFSIYADMIFSKSWLLNEERVNEFLDGYKPGKAADILKDPAYQLSDGIYSFYVSNISARINSMEQELEGLQMLYMKALMEMQPEKHFYPDANSTLRIAYGKVEGFTARDAIQYTWYTTLAGIIEKEDTTVYDYIVDKRLIELYKNRDYGRYADADSTLHVCFIASNHTSGGNSGSPVLNADGHLIGINFDRVWEGTMSDLMFDPDHCRNISLDIRYCLFVIEKIGKANRLLDEMKIVE